MSRTARPSVGTRAVPTGASSASRRAMRRLRSMWTPSCDPVSRTASRCRTVASSAVSRTQVTLTSSPPMARPIIGASRMLTVLV